MSTEREISDEVLSFHQCLEYSIMLQVMPAYPEINNSKAFLAFQKSMWKALTPIFIKLRNDLIEEGIELEKFELGK